TPTQSRRIPTHEPERRRRLSLPAAGAAPPASSRPFPQPGRSQRLPSSSASLCRVLICTAADPLLVTRWERHVESFSLHVASHLRLNATEAFMFRSFFCDETSPNKQERSPRRRTARRS